MTANEVVTQQSSVVGTVKDPDGNPIAGAVVTVAERRLRSEELLGQDRTDADGRYRVDYQGGAGSVGMIVRVTGNGHPVVESSGVPAGPGETTIDVRLSADIRAEYDAVFAAVTPLLDGAAISSLDDADVAHLAGATGRDNAQVAQLVAATRCAEATALPAPAFYGLLRRGFPAELSAMAERSRDIPAALAGAAAAKVIESDTGAADFAIALCAYVVDAAVDPPDGESAAPIGQLFIAAVPDLADRKRWYAAYLDRAVDNAEFLRAPLNDEPESRDAARLRLALRLAELTENNIPLALQLLARFDAGEFTHPRELVRLDGEWAELIAAAGGTPSTGVALLGAADVVQQYAGILRARVAQAYPTAHIANELSRHPAHAETAATRFLTGNPEFDLLGTPVNAATVPEPQTRHELAEIQRTFKIARRFEAMQALRDNGFRSAYEIAGLGRDTFASKVADTVDPDEAGEIHARATAVHAAAVNLVADFRTAGHFDVPWLPSFAADGSAAHPIPNWEELFGPADYGVFDDAHSVYGEAAYLVDLLYFLRRLGGGNDTDEGHVANVLFARRGDLRDVELSMANTTLALPYVDLVNELLESVVAPATAIPAERRQSSGDAATLRIQPQHVNPGAYQTLRTAVYPWDLPYDLFRDQTTNYLAHVGTPRLSLLEIFGAEADSPNLPVDDRLNLNSVAAQIIAGEQLTPARTLNEYFGKPASVDLVDSVHIVRDLLDTASLRYAELTELLDTRFVNPGAVLRIKADRDSPYATTLMTIEGLDAPALDRLHRFVRLQRALGWSATTLDRVIAGSNSHGSLDRPTLRTIGAVRELAARLDLSIEQVLTFYNPVETHAYPTDAEPSLYDRLFLDPSVVTTEAGAPNPFALRADRTELAVLGSLTTPTVTAALLAVLQVTDTDLAALTTGTRAVTADRLLNLANLSALVRTVTLARALSLSIPDLLRLIELHGSSPFGAPVAAVSAAVVDTEVAGGAPRTPPARPALPAFPIGVDAEVSAGARQGLPTELDVAPGPLTYTRTIDTERFLDAVDALANAGYSVAELNAVLAATESVPGEIMPDDADLAGTLTTLRAALQAVYQQTAQTLDERGELTRKQLTLLGWDPGLAQESVETLLGTITYTAKLSALPAKVVFPQTIPIRYNPTDKTLFFTGPMTDAQQTALEKLLPGNAEYVAAVRQLGKAPREFVRTRMKARRIPVYAARLDVLPAGFQLPKALVGKVFYDVNDHMLKCRGYLSADEAEALKTAPGGSGVAGAVATLLVNQEADEVGDNKFLDGAIADDFFKDDTVGPVGRFRVVLGILNPLLRRYLGESAVKQQLGQAAGLDPATADLLLGTWLRSTLNSTVLNDFLLSDFVSSDPAVELTRTAFGQQFVALQRIHRAALVLTKLGVSAAELPFVFGYAGRAGWIDLNELPSTRLAGASALFGKFIRLLDLIRLRATVPGGLGTLDKVFQVAVGREATVAKVIGELAARTGWAADDLTGLAALLGLSGAASFLDVPTMRTVVAAVAALRRLGVTPERLASWLHSMLTPTAAQAAWQTAKAKHTLKDWPIVAAPMQDGIRDRQRTALVSYLVANPLLAGDKTPQWRDANGLHDYFLLDVEMGADHLTTRIAQSSYAIQLYVQRCLLNLESQIGTTDSVLWDQWEWMKQYRLWEANQKVFLYPENYFEPDLRPDKSPFFAELENRMMQSEVTANGVEGGIRRYLEDLSTVSRLQPCGSYLNIKSPSAQTLYVVARTDSTPRSYYFRTWDDFVTWSPWQKIELDIDSENVMPVYWNGRLYVFWWTFTSVSAQKEEFKMPKPGDTVSSGPMAFLVDLQWTSYQDGAWQNKQVSRQRLTITDLPEAIWSQFPFYWQAQPEFDSATGDLIIRFIHSEFTGRPDPQPCYNGFFIINSRGSVTAQEFSMSSSYGIVRPPHKQANAGNTFNEIIEKGWSGETFATVDVFDPANHPPQDLLRKTPGARDYRLLYPHQQYNGPEFYYQFFSDYKRSYLLEPYPFSAESAGYRLHPLYHAHVESFFNEVNRLGVPGLYQRELQTLPEKYSGRFDFGAEYDPVRTAIVGDLPGEPVDFVYDSATQQYNWELFFHAPLLAAQRLSVERKFDEAQAWFHLIFDPTDRSGLSSPQRYWRTKPFYETSKDPDKPGSYYYQRIEEVLRRLADGNVEELRKVVLWLRNPFQPDIVARTRTTAYQKAVVMKYLDNLIAWGDQLFRQDTGESINQAIQLYILAAELLGRRPEEVRSAQPAPVKSFRRLLADMSTNPVVAAESLVPVDNRTSVAPVAPSITVGVGKGWYDYFHVPRNEKLLGYWDLVDDRLTKIRTGRNIDGVQRQLSAYGSQIDPNLLVRAIGTGFDLGTALDDISAPMPHYRFGPMLAKAKELAAEVKEFGAALLSALEKRDGEALSRLRADHEIATLAAARRVRGLQITEAIEALDAAGKQRVIAQGKVDYYTNREFMNSYEQGHTRLVREALKYQRIASGIDLAASIMGLFPEIKVGFPTTIGITFGGSNLSNSLHSLAGSLDLVAKIWSDQGQLYATMGGYQRRQDEWTFQLGLAKTEVELADKQISAAKVRQQIAETELANHDLQTRQTDEVARFLHRKYTNQELYDWLVGQLATSFFQAYQLAYDVAKRAERAYRHELGVADSAFVKFGYWDNLHKGLMSGERLLADLNQMDAAFLDANARELELSKRISLAQLDARALLALKETGRCYVTLPEALFDLDTPGHYFRRIKTLSVTVPCVAGPYSGVNLTATLTRSSVRVDPQLSGGQYARKAQDLRFRDYSGPIQSIVTSTGQDDSGMFETNLHDERFLPFEGEGAISEWQLSLPNDYRQFDYESITDVVLHLRYTARDGGDILARKVVTELDEAVDKWVHAGGGSGMLRVFSTRREFADQWQRFVATPAGQTAKATFRLSKSSFPHLFRGHRYTVANPELVLVLSHDLGPDGTTRYVDHYPDGAALNPTLAVAGDTDSVELQPDPTLGRLPRATCTHVSVEMTEAGQDWIVTAPISGLDANLLTPDGRLDPAAVLDLLLVCPFTLKAN